MSDAQYQTPYEHWQLTTYGDVLPVDYGPGCPDADYEERRVREQAEWELWEVSQQ